MKQLDQYQPPGEPSKPHKLFPLQFIGSLKADLSNAWLIKGILPKTGLAVIYGSPGSGKSFAALNMTLRIASGQPFAGCKTKRGGTVYISAEAGLGFKKRVVAARDALQLPDDTPFALVAVAPDLGRADGDTEPLMNQIYSQADRANLWPDVIVIDTAARVIPGLDENSSRDMGMLVRNCDAIAKNFEGLVILVHHSGKVADSGMRGSSALLGAADCVISIASDETGLRTAVIEKQKDGEDGQSFTFRLQSATLGNDEDGDPVSTCIVSDVTDLKRAEPAKRKSGPSVPASLRLLPSGEGRLAVTVWV